jgi:hypothetical protein
MIANKNTLKEIMNKLFALIDEAKKAQDSELLCALINCVQVVDKLQGRYK